MIAALTDRERALKAEARVAELEEELAAWRGNADHDTARRDYVMRLQWVRERLKPARANASGAGPASVLLRMIDAPGKVFNQDELMEGTRGLGCDPDYEPDRKIIAVHVSKLRRALIVLGFGPVISTSWGQGFYVEPAAAAAVKAAWFEAAHV